MPEAANTAACDGRTDSPQPAPETLDGPDLGPDPDAVTVENGGCNDLVHHKPGQERPEEKEMVDAVASAVGAVSDSIPAVQICVRVRPMLQWEKAEGYEASAMELKEGINGTVALKEDGRHRHFGFNAVIGGDRTQQEVWEMSRLDAVVRKVALGFHATVFAYGQTGTGKTHTMEGFTYEHHCGIAPTMAAARPRVKAKATPAEQLGIVPRAVVALFDRVEAIKAEKDVAAPATSAPESFAPATSASSFSSTSSCVVRLSFLQIYNEKIFDLLNPSSTVSQREAGGRGEEFSGLRLRWDAARRHFFVENLFQYECSSAEEALQHYQQGIQNKQVASTTMNVASSRSHTLLVLTLLRREGDEEGNRTPRRQGRQGQGRPCQEVISQLSLVDLAGSERSIAGVSGRDAGKSTTRFQEAVNVNQSLFVLRRVITALSKREATGRNEIVHVPYRESKLTSLLQNSLGGNSYLVMFACVAPSERQDDENLSTLQYASQAACIRNQPVVNLDPKDQLIQQLEARLAVAHEYLRRTLQVAELPEDLLEEERRAAGAPRRPRPRLKAKAAPKKRTAHGQAAQEHDGAHAQAAQAAPATGTGQSRSARAKTWTGLEQRWGFQDEPRDPVGERKQKNQETASESSRESSKSTTKPVKRMSGREASSATSTLSRVVQGAAQKSPSCDDWPFAVRSKKSETKGQELFAAVDAMMRGYDGPKPSPRKPKPRPASLPPVVPEVSASQWPPKPPKESPAASAQSSETALDGMAGSKCSCCGSDRPPQTDAEAEKGAVSMEDALQLQKALDVQRRLEEELLAAHGRIQNLEVQQTKLSGEQAMMQNLQSENTELQRRLEVFYKAMEFEADERDAHPTEQQDLTPKGVVPPSPEIEAVASIRQKIEKFHSQLVLEAVTLRNEVARLKKKKWIIKAVLDNGGEHERQAIVEEVAQLRSKREFDGSTAT
ncbi:Kinesin-like protein KIF7 [Durusdinium trenchii]|uniref:Kinesin-like protein n=1 Tax=Durusdinium trenchii TaxID=1381693 RepID=A0ABP0KJV0_9DINO